MAEPSGGGHSFGLRQRHRRRGQVFIRVSVAEKSSLLSGSQQTAELEIAVIHPHIQKNILQARVAGSALSPATDDCSG